MIPKPTSKVAAGVIPFCVRDGRVLFLFHKTFSGRRAGLLVDFGGGARPDENHRQTAIREFIEETEAMFFSDNVHAAPTREQLQSQTQLLETLFENTLSHHPHWWCRRKRGGKARNWKTFFIEFEYRDVTQMNTEWELNPGARFSKRRELVWIAADTLVDLYARSPECLWKRVRQLSNIRETIESIVASKAGGAKLAHCK